MNNKYYKVYQIDFDRYSIEITNNSNGQMHFMSLDLDEIDLEAMMSMLNSLGFMDLSPVGDEE